ncbi:MAG: hypothetical protein K5857_03905, partial [Lachnospiraceae bacterium]|nr:hypothetical protein [Lachnospiraceae bacterium]
TRLIGTTSDGSFRRVVCTVIVRGKITGLLLKEKAAVRGYNNVTLADDENTAAVEYESAMRKGSGMVITPVPEINGVSAMSTVLKDKQTYARYRAYTDTDVSYRSSNTSLATVDRMGRIFISRSAAAGDQVLIYVTAQNGENRAILRVTVR